jgi:hypothetical protein
MSSRLLAKVPALLLSVLLGAAGCSAAGAAEEPAVDSAVTVEESDSGQPARITLTDEAEERLGVETKPVVAGPAARAGRAALLIPYSAVVYDADGKAWAFAVTAEHTYQRRLIVIASITNETVALTRGPAVGTQLVTVGAPELVGAEAGISGEE